MFRTRLGERETEMRALQQQVRDQTGELDTLLQAASHLDSRAVAPFPQIVATQQPSQPRRLSLLPIEAGGRATFRPVVRSVLG